MTACRCRYRVCPISGSGPDRCLSQLGQYNVRCRGKCDPHRHQPGWPLCPALSSPDGTGESDQHRVPVHVGRQFTVRVRRNGRLPSTIPASGDRGKRGLRRAGGRICDRRRLRNRQRVCQQLHCPHRRHEQDGKDGLEVDDYGRGGTGFWFHRGGNSIVGQRGRRQLIRRFHHRWIPDRRPDAAQLSRCRQARAGARLHHADQPVHRVLRQRSLWHDQLRTVGRVYLGRQPGRRAADHDARRLSRVERRESRACALCHTDNVIITGMQAFARCCRAGPQRWRHLRHSRLTLRESQSGDSRFANRKHALRHHDAPQRRQRRGSRATHHHPERDSQELHQHPGHSRSREWRRQRHVTGYPQREIRTHVDAGHGPAQSRRRAAFGQHLYVRLE